MYKIFALKPLQVAEIRRRFCSEKMLGGQKYRGLVIHVTPLGGTIGAVGAQFRKNDKILKICMGVTLTVEDRG